jgi:N-acetylglucosamine-6-phosphate deacetylase
LWLDDLRLDGLHGVKLNDAQRDNLLSTGVYLTAHGVTAQHPSRSSTALE